MKYLSDYIEEATTALLNQHGAFFAFDDKQFKEAQKEGVGYVSMGIGLICPRANAKAFNKGYADIVAAGIAQDITENSLDNIIRRELANHECYYTGDIQPAYDALSAYPDVTEAKVYKRYKAEIEL